MAEFASYSFSNKYKLYVTWVDHGTYIRDVPSISSLGNVSQEGGRNFRVTGFRLDGVGDPLKYNIVVPQEIQGSFKLPQIGDVILIEENYREPGAPPTYVYSIYNDLPLDNYASAPLPNWGSLPNDYGHLRSHRDHNAQFSSSANSSFVKKYIKSITGYRFRKFYGHVYDTTTRFLDRGKFVVRGDSVFDIEKNSSLMSNEFIETESGMDIISVNDNSLTSDPGDYPNPLNVPKKREKNEDYRIASDAPSYLQKSIETDYYVMDSGIDNKYKIQTYISELKVKNYLSYQPIIDKKYLDYLNEQNSEDNEDLIRLFKERELPAAEEYQVALRGNNKLLIQDQYGDGEQILITLKNQYDAGFTVVHNVENGQVRIRDHLGQGVLLEANPEAPRVVTWTTERQVIDMGSIRTFDPESGDTETQGEYIYLRNGSVYGKSDTSFGRIPESEISRDEVSQQEFLMVNSSSDTGFSKLLDSLSSRLSKGIYDITSGAGGNGFFFRNNPDPKETNQFISMFNTFDEQPVFTTRMYQEHRDELNGKNIVTDFTQEISNDESSVSQTSSYEDSSVSSSVEHILTSNATNATEERTVTYDGSSGLSSYAYESVANSSESKTTTVNSFDGKSEVQVVTKAQQSGTSEETKKLKDLTSSNEIELYMNTDSPTTRLTQKIAGAIINTSELSDTAITHTQYGPAGTANNKIEQTAGNIKIQRIVNAVDITLTGKNVKIQGEAVDIEEI
jgi:hypothetical protein